MHKIAMRGVRSRLVQSKVARSLHKHTAPGRDGLDLAYHAWDGHSVAVTSFTWWLF